MRFSQFSKINNKSTLRINVLGGLGNQLFLLFFGIAVSKYLKKDLVIEDKLIGFGSNPNRKLAISSFTFKNLSVIYRKNYYSKLQFLYSNIFFRRLMWRFIHARSKPMTETDIKKSDFRFNSNQTFSGYFQDWFYVDLVYEMVQGFEMDLSEPTPFYNELSTAIEIAKPICVHVRLGDYLHHPDKFSILPERYFLNSIDYLSSGTECPVWCFVESELELTRHYPKLAKLCKKIIDKKEHVNDNETFALLMNSSKLIASNSTYSLWAAWFAEKNGARVVVPFEMGIKGAGDGLNSSRWDQYDFNQNVIIPKTIEEETYNLKKREFERKFK